MPAAAVAGIVVGAAAVLLGVGAAVGFWVYQKVANVLHVFF
jgi:hypothetical protein